MKPIKISVVAFNDQKFNGNSCYNMALTSCRPQESIAQEIKYYPVTTRPETTTKRNDGSVKRYQLITFASVFISLLFSL